MEVVYRVISEHKMLCKYLIMGLAALLVKVILDHIFAKKTATPPNGSGVAADAPDGGLFADKNVVEESDGNYFYDKYIPSIEEDSTHIPFSLPRYDHATMLQRSRDFYELVNQRRSCRFFSSDPVEREVIEQCVLAGGTSPSGAHTEPWRFVVVSNKEDREVIRSLVEEEERVNYERRMGKKWLADLQSIKTTFVKEYISEAPAIILVFKVPYHDDEKGVRHNHWYYEASVSIAVGILLCALNNVGLVTVTSTPMNCGPALRRLLNRPDQEKLAYLLPIGYPSNKATVPDFGRKPLEEICTFVE